MRGLAAVVAVLGVLAGPGAAATWASFSMSVNPVVAPEGGTFTVTVTRTAVAPLNAASVKVVTGAVGPPPDSAMAADYSVPANNTLSWGALETGSKSLVITAASDELDEDDELFTIRLSDPMGDPISGLSSQTVTITDDPADVPPTMTIADATVVEGSGGATTTLSFNVALSAASGRSVTASYATSNGTATAGQDYTASAGTLTIPAGSKTGKIDVPVTPDEAVEQDETFSIALTNPMNATLGTPSNATGTITNDDTLPTLSITAPAPTAEGSSGLTTPFDFVISLSKRSTTQVTVTYSTADGSATAPADYAAADKQQVTFAPGETSKTVSVAVRADTDTEPNEEFSVTISDPGGLVATTGSASATIVDDDGPSQPSAQNPGSGGGSTLGARLSAVDLVPPAMKVSRPTLSRSGVLILRVACPAGEKVCRGTVSVFSKPAPKSKVKALRGELKIGKTNFVIPGGQTARLTLRLSKRVLGLLRRARTMRVTAFVVGRDAAGNIGTTQKPGTLRRLGG